MRRSRDPSSQGCGRRVVRIGGYHSGGKPTSTARFCIFLSARPLWYENPSFLLGLLDDIKGAPCGVGLSASTQPLPEEGRPVRPAPRKVFRWRLEFRRQGSHGI